MSPPDAEAVVDQLLDQITQCNSSEAKLYQRAEQIMKASAYDALQARGCGFQVNGFMMNTFLLAALITMLDKVFRFLYRTLHEA